MSERAVRPPRRLTLLLLGALLFAPSAGAQALLDGAGRSPHRFALLRGGVHVLGAETLERLVAPQADPGRLVFQSPTPTLRHVSRGDVLVSAAGARAPYGFLRRVTRVERQAGNLVLETEPAALEDVFWWARAQDRITLRSADIAVAVPRVEGVQLPDAAAEAWSPGKLEFELLDVVLYDLDGNPATMGDQIRVTGKVGVEPTFDVDLDIAWGRIRRFQFNNTTRLSTTLELDGRVAASIDRTLTVASVEFAPVTIMVGPVPLVFTPVLDVQVGVSGSVSAGLRTSVTAAVPVSVEVVYADGRWGGSADLPDGPEDIELDWLVPELTAEARARVQAGPRLALLLYGVSGPFASVFGYTSLVAEVLPGRVWSLDVGLHGDLGLLVRVPGAPDSVPYSLQVFDRAWRVADGSF